MMGSLVVGGLLAMSLALGGSAQAQSSCDAGVTKALAKKVSCKLKLFAAAQKRAAAVDSAKLARCEAKFAASCAKAQSRGDCQAQASSCAALEARADAAVDDLRGTPNTTTTSTTTSTTTTLDPFRSCGRDPDGTCGGLCDSFFDDCVQDDQSGACVCVPGPCRAVGGIGSCGGTCQDPRATCTLFPVPGGCVCIIPCAGSGAPPCDPACQPGQGCIFDPNTSACECAP